MIDSFVYCWTDHATNKLYVGSHKGTIDDSYICSSKPMMEQYNTRTQDFTRQIIAEGEYKDIRKLESAILKSCNAATNDDFYNLNNGDGKFHSPKHLSEEHKRKIGEANSKALKGKKLSPERIEKLRGKKHTEEWKQSLSVLHKGNKYNLGRKASDKTREKLDISIRSRKDLEKILNRGQRKWH